MTEGHSGTPWHLWVVGLVATLWNGFGCYMYVMAMIRDPATFAAAPPEMVAAFEVAPAWSHGAWALGVWGGLAGSLLLLLRNRIAIHAFVVSLVGLVGTTTYETMWDVPVDQIQRLVIWVIALFLLWYGWTMRRRGVLS